MMVVEIAAGWFHNSMALLADGLHMSSPAVAIGLSAFAYAATRKHAKDPRFAFGTCKIELPGGFTSAIFLPVVAAPMVYGSVEHLGVTPQPIHCKEAIYVGVLGLVINTVSALILGAARPGNGSPGGRGNSRGQRRTRRGKRDGDGRSARRAGWQGVLLLRSRRRRPR
jgi:cation diffusion facilitator family transporter